MKIPPNFKDHTDMEKNQMYILGENGELEKFQVNYCDNFLTGV
jgi:hypothetical protein